MSQELNGGWLQDAANGLDPYKVRYVMSVPFSCHVMSFLAIKYLFNIGCCVSVPASNGQIPPMQGPCDAMVWNINNKKIAGRAGPMNGINVIAGCHYNYKGGLFVS